jgi:hypothetical protein
MITTRMKQAILKNLEQLPERDQRQVLAYARTLTGGGQSGTPGRALLKFSGAIKRSDLATMAKAIEEGCEKVDLNGW